MPTGSLHLLQELPPPPTPPPPAYDYPQSPLTWVPRRAERAHQTTLECIQDALTCYPPFQPVFEVGPVKQEESESLQQAVAKRPGSAGSSMNAFQLMASALDISAILEDRMESRSLNTRFLSKAQPGAVIAYLEEEASTRGGRLVRSNDCRCLWTPPPPPCPPTHRWNSPIFSFFQCMNVILALVCVQILGQCIDIHSILIGIFNSWLSS